MGSLLSATAAFIWLALRLDGGGLRKRHDPTKDVMLEQSAKTDVEHIFNDEFREELRNRGRLHFEKIIGENAMFLQQDLRQTTSQLNDYMRAEITRTLQDEFKKYEQSISDAKQMALDSIEKTIATIEQQRQFLENQLETQSKEQKSVIVAAFERQMANIINHYVLRAIGNQIDLSDQLDFILAELETNKSAILEDIKRGT
ncbi:MAG TPA: hypothetical protein VHL10_02820 [Nitrososphaera sp.]|nr:hypothetical protein [Nitrososphaera sp.]